MSKCLSMNSVDLLYNIFSFEEKKMASLLLKHTFFINPAQAMQAVYPNFARESREYHPGIKKGGKSVFNSCEVKIVGNLKARNAFSRLSGHKLNGKGRTVSKGWEVAHIWGRVYDPECFTAGWNLCLMPNFLRDLTEEQNAQIFFQKIIQQASFNLFFSSGIHQVPDYVKNHHIDLGVFLGNAELNILGKGLIPSLRRKA